MDAKKELKVPVVHICIEAYLNHICRGKFPSRLLTSCPFDDFEHNGKKYVVGLELMDSESLLKNIDFEQIINSDATYVKKLMERFNKSSMNFSNVIKRVLEREPQALLNNQNELAQSYLFKVISLSPPPPSIKQSMQKVSFYRSFCFQVLHAFLAGKNPEDFSQYAATRPKIVNRIRKMYTYMSFDCINKGQLYNQFIGKQDFINAQALTFLSEIDLKTQLCINILHTFNEAVSIVNQLIRQDSKRVSLPYFNLNIIQSSNSQLDMFEPMEFFSDMTVEDVLANFTQFLKCLKSSLEDKKTSAVLDILRQNPFLSKAMIGSNMPDELIEKIQDFLNQHPLVETISDKKLN